MSNITNHLLPGERTVRHASLLASLTLLAGLAACSNTVATGGKLFAPANYAALSEVWDQLPVEESGDLPAPSMPQGLPAEYHIVVHYNPSSLPPAARWCDSKVIVTDGESQAIVLKPAAPVADLQVAAALCHHRQVVTTAQGLVPLGTTTLEQRRRDITFIERQLLDQLDPDPTHGLEGG